VAEPRSVGAGPCPRFDFEPDFDFDGPNVPLRLVILRASPAFQAETDRPVTTEDLGPPALALCDLGVLAYLVW